MRPDPFARSAVLMLAGVLILLALSTVAGNLMQKTMATRPRPTAVIPRPTPPLPPTTREALATIPPPLPTVAPDPPAPLTATPAPPPAPPRATVEVPTPSATPLPGATRPPLPTPPPPTAPTLPGIAHPTGAREIVLQMREEGGALPRLDALAAGFPTFTLLGDGTLVYHTRTAYYQTRLDEAAIQDVLTQAITETRFLALEPFYADPTLADAPALYLRVVAAGQDHTVGAAGLGRIAADGSAPPDAPRARLLRLVAALRARMPEDGPPLVPAAVTLYAEGGSPTAPADPAPPWPLPGVTLAAILQGSNGGPGEALRLTGPAAATALVAAATPRPFLEAGRRYMAVAVPDGP